MVHPTPGLEKFGRTIDVMVHNPMKVSAAFIFMMIAFFVTVS